MPNPLEPPLEPETLSGDEVASPRCQNLLPNKMQCTRYATWVLGEDLKTAICDVCFVIEHKDNLGYQPIMRGV